MNKRPKREIKPPNRYTPSETDFKDDISVDTDWDKDDLLDLLTGDNNSIITEGEQDPKNDEYEYDDFVVPDDEEIEEAINSSDDNTIIEQSETEEELEEEEVIV